MTPIYVVQHLDAIAVDEAPLGPRLARKEAPKPECTCPEFCLLDHDN